MDDHETEYQHFDNTTEVREIILVTGASGLIGFKLIEELAKNYMVIGLDKSNPPYTPEHSKFLNFDLTDKKSISDALKRIRLDYGNKITSVIHLAAFYSFESKYDEMYNAVNVEGTKCFLELLQEFEVNQFIFSSTDLIYIPVEKGEKLNENAGINAKWGYPTSKILTEDLILKYDGKFRSVILRIAEVYDDYGNSTPLSHQIKRIYDNKITSHLYAGNLEHGDAFVHLDDVILAIIRTVERRNILPGQVVINIGEPYSPSYGTLQKTISTLIHRKPWKTYQVPKWIAKAGSGFMNLTKSRYIKPWMIEQSGEHYELDISKAKELLDWEPRHTLLKTMPVIIGNLNQDPKQWYRKNKLL